MVEITAAAASGVESSTINMALGEKGGNKEELAFAVVSLTLPKLS